MLASDLNNREFVGAVNPDDLLQVEFYWHEPVDWNKTQDTGREVKTGQRIPYVRISAPGNLLNVREAAVLEDHKRRWPQKWLAWQIQEGLIEAAGSDVPGWKLQDWPALNPDQVRELNYLRFSTVEQLAGASDGQIQRIGMGGIGLRERAKQAVKERHRAEMKAELDADREQREKELQTLRDKDAAREKEMKELREMISLMQTAPKEPVKRRGRPPKQKEAEAPQNG